MAIPATGNSCRRWSLGGFSPNQYVTEFDHPRRSYDLIAFVRDPVQRFLSVWDWMRNRISDFSFMKQDPTTVDKHLRPLYTFPNILEVDYLGRFEALENDWGNLQKRYSLGPFRKPPVVIGTKKWDKLLTREELKRVVDYYSTDFETFGYEAQAYLDATR